MCIPKLAKDGPTHIIDDVTLAVREAAVAASEAAAKAWAGDLVAFVERVIKQQQWRAVAV